MRRIIITITDNHERKEVETGIEVEESASSSEREDCFALIFLPKIIAAISPGAKVVTIGKPGQEMDELRQGSNRGRYPDRYQEGW